MTISKHAESIYLHTIEILTNYRKNRCIDRVRMKNEKNTFVYYPIKNNITFVTQKKGSFLFDFTIL